MPDIWMEIGELVIWLAKVIGAIGVIAAVLWKPLRWVHKTLKDTHDISVETKEIQYDQLFDRLQSGRNYWLSQQYCPLVEKKSLYRLYDSYTREKDTFGKPMRNGLADTYKDDLKNLPECPPRIAKKRKCPEPIAEKV